MKKLTRVVCCAACLALALLQYQSKTETLGTGKVAAATASIFAADDYFCGTDHDPVTIAIHERDFDVRRRAASPAELQRDVGTVNVHFHIITDGVKGDVADSVIVQQMRVLNRSYELRGLNFDLASVERITNAKWFTSCGTPGVEKQIRSTLHVGTATDLNVYTCEPVKFLGRAAFPWTYADSPELDGIVVHHDVLPGGSIDPFNTGEVLVHESGHWMGLYHTFQGGCGGDGDYVADSPDELSANFDSCPLDRDTCPQPGFDPVENYMDYSGDACWDQFTPGQYTRMQEQFALYRAGQ